MYVRLLTKKLYGAILLIAINGGKIMLCETFKYLRLLELFEEISAIPRMSYHEEKIADYLVDFAKARGLEYYRDKWHNVLINIDATAGYESCDPILFQGHTDMVCQKNDGVEHDF